MTTEELPNNMNPKYQEGLEEGFKIADDYFKSALKDFYKEVKRGLINSMATTTVSYNWRIDMLKEQKAYIEKELSDLQNKIK